MSDRKYDIILYGATGFTGGLVAEYLAANSSKDEVRWAIAGRNQAKLEAVKNKILEKVPDANPMDILIADSNQEEQLNAMCASTKILATTVGPYALYGEPLVKACVENGTHYLDITGEPEFVKEMLEKYDAKAKASNTLVINCCGFDSIPADAGAYFTASKLSSEPKNIRCYVTGNGSFSGGTWASAIHAFSHLFQSDLKNVGASGSSDKNPGFHYVSAIRKWAVPMPVIDPWMVKRSSMMQKEIYGNGFSYAQYLAMKDLPTMGALLAGVAGLVLASQFEPTRNLLLNYRKSGEGPSEEQRAKSFFKVYFIGEANGQQVKCSVSGGDPGYSETAKMLSEAALTVLRHYDELSVKGGVVTPAGALGQFLIDRLVAAGIRFEVEG